MWSVALVVYMLRHNVSEDVAAERFGVSQPTASRRWDALREVIAEALDDVVPAPAEVVGAGSVLVDGSVAPSWDWRHRVDLYSGKVGDTGFNIQLAATVAGDLVAVGDPVPGARHDAYAFAASGLAQALAGCHTVADKGYDGVDGVHVVPFKKPAGGALLEWQKQFNTGLNTPRAAVERAVAHLKNWKMLKTRYRAPLHKFSSALRAIAGLHFLTKAFE